ncbi:MAG: histidinol dehydrogenase [Bernardetiaceae bacterium]|jgi:histidinol dehydrogenase|nr:histidinol dehydrogenase [Bernardetiaceae bacterium]
MQFISYPNRQDWPALLARPVSDVRAMEKKVKPIIKKVKKQGDKALYKLAHKFDNAKLDNLVVTAPEFAEAEQAVSPALKTAMQTAVANLEKFHAAQREQFAPVETMPGVTCWRRSLPIQRVGLYAPGGTAPLFSSVLMLGVPARLAGCQEVVLCSPPNAEGKIHPAILYAAQLVGITKVIKAGGAQAVAAMAFGTESVPQVYKIFGPGNQFVTAAKQFVARFGVAIDMPAGPSEVAVLADDTARPEFVAADLLSQAEHGIDSQVLLVSTSQALLQAVQREIERQVEALPRRVIAKVALEHSRAILVRQPTEAVELLNEYAAEHLILAVAEPEKVAEQIVNAGSVFLGHYTPEAVGDYASGTNHTLPTNGFAKAWAGVSLDSFMRKVTYQQLTPAGLQALGQTVEIMAEAEQLQAHKEAVSVRLRSLEK